jgi:hypothetical protein
MKTTCSRYDPEGVPLSPPVHAAVRRRLIRYYEGVLHFRAVWKALTEQGVCSSPVDSERRVYDEWVDAGYPETIGDFIRQSQRQEGPRP